nr:MAG: hypothetical protein [Betatorquevirus sp.]
MFPPVKKNRLMNAWEQQEEKQDAAIWCRPQRKYLYDKPTYPFFPPTPIIPKINFDLMYSE